MDIVVLLESNDIAGLAAGMMAPQDRILHTDYSLAQKPIGRGFSALAPDSLRISR